MTQSENTSTVSVTIDGRCVRALSGSTVLEACKAAGIHIPTLCDDPRLEPYGGCRLCIVQIEGVRGFPASCAAQVTDGMVVTTTSDAIFNHRKTVIELLLSDHKVECLTCESTGSCELQDVAYAHGIESVRFQGAKHTIPAPVDDGLLIQRDYEKCISCGRCQRICHEVQGCDVYGYTGRGFDSLPATAFGATLLESGCEFCGQCVSACPTGALIDRRSRFGGRVWETTRTRSTCGYCGVGCTIDYRVRAGRIVGASAPLDAGVNRGNLCAKGRYGWSFTHHPQRLTTPLIRKSGELVEVEWDEAEAYVARRLAETIAAHGADAVAGLASAKCTNEENYLFQKFMRAVIGTHNIDHCARL